MILLAQLFVFESDEPLSWPLRIRFLSRSPTVGLIFSLLKRDFRSEEFGLFTLYLTQQ